MAKQGRTLTLEDFKKAKAKWKKMKGNKRQAKKIGQDLVGCYLGKYLRIARAVYDKRLSPPLWFEIATLDGYSFAFNSKAFASFLAKKGERDAD